MTMFDGSTGRVPDRKLYECTDCLSHHASTERVTVCPDCGGATENLTKPRAQ